MEGNEIFSHLNKLKTITNAPARIVLLTNNYTQNLSGLKELLEQQGLEIEKIKENQEQILWSLTLSNEDEQQNITCPHCGNNFKVEENHKVIVKNYFIEFANSNLLILVSNNKSNFKDIISRLNALYPLIGRIFYRAAELKLILDSINEIKNVEVIGRECVAKRLFEDKKTIVKYEQDTVENFFKDARRDNSWIDSIEVLIKPLGIIRLSRKGTILYSKPFNFSGFYEIIVRNIVTDILKKRRRQFSQKARTITNPNIKPITIKFDKNYFEEEENIHKLIKRLNQSSKYEVSVLYMGDCLAHIECFDYATGGGFDIFINSSDSLKIVAQTQVTEVTIESIILKISDLFEGTIL